MHVAKKSPAGRARRARPAAGSVNAAAGGRCVTEMVQNSNRASVEPVQCEWVCVPFHRPRNHIVAALPRAAAWTTRDSALSRGRQRRGRRQKIRPGTDTHRHSSLHLLL